VHCNATAELNDDVRTGSRRQLLDAWNEPQRRVGRL